MKKLVLLLALIIAMVFAGCSSAPYTQYEPQAATDNPVGTKVGEGPMTPTGIQEAAQKAGITKIATVDIKTVFDGKVYTRVYIVSGE
ncbi:MAG: TRL-like family protein [Treponema sp.]|jgi:PBP1b-binding outer membrane lipoprotein LpoB|nr:TRL-like family protein [Treponema sp.]